MTQAPAKNADHECYVGTDAGGELSGRTHRRALQKKLEALRSDFATVTGRPFQNFFCPVLFQDDPGDLCGGHLVNQAFPGGSNRWTVQRADVDNFYGSHFEADFIDLKERSSPIDTLITHGPVGRLRPKISLRGEEIDYYRPTSIVPPGHSVVRLEAPSGNVQLALKIAPQNLLNARNEDWQFSIEKDCRLAALVSLLKTAHLILFEMLGYSYALSAGGAFLGKTVLGDFFLKSRFQSREKILHAASIHFEEFKNLVRPVLTPNTIEDALDQRVLYICEGSCKWAFLVFIRTGKLAHAVIVPYLETPDAASRFISFLNSDGNKFQARRCHYDGDVFHASPLTNAFDWPAVTLD